MNNLLILEKLKKIEGKIDAYNQILKWSYEPGVNQYDLQGLIQNELKRIENHVSLLKLNYESVS